MISACGPNNVYGPNPYPNQDSNSEPLDVYGPNPYSCDTGDDAYCKNTFGDKWVCGAENNCVQKNNDSQSDDDAGSDANSDAQSDN